MENYSYLNNVDPSEIEELYSCYKNNPESVNSAWRRFFEGIEIAQFTRNENNDFPKFNADEFNVIDLINAYRQRGHLYTKTSIVRSGKKYFPSLSIDNFGLTDAEMNTEYFAGNEICEGKSKLCDIIAHLQQTYCQSIGVEFMHIDIPEVVEWLKVKMEKNKNTYAFSHDEKKQILYQLCKAVNYEQFIDKKFPNHKSFSIAGAETIIPALYFMIESAEQSGIKEFVMGMANHGRLNILANILNKKCGDVFGEPDLKTNENALGNGDYRYQPGFYSEYLTNNNNTVQINIAPNPMHPEVVGSVVEGIVRAKIDHEYIKDYSKIVSVLIHGDTSIAGQGIIYEVIQMSMLDGYKTGGSVHLVINNQLDSFTNVPNTHSGNYCTDVAKTIQSPVFHVNGEDVEAVIYIIKLAMEFRQRFHRDVFIDLLYYRRWDQIETDETRDAQSHIYNKIEAYPDLLGIYAKHLIESEIITNAYLQQIQSDFIVKLEQEYREAQLLNKGNIASFMQSSWEGIKKMSAEDYFKVPTTRVDSDILIHLARKITLTPPNICFYKKIAKLMSDRMEMIEVTDKLDWGMCEMLAYATLLDEGYPIRISGQDVECGAFSHRQAVLKIEGSEEKYIPLTKINKEQASFEIYNSLHSEGAVLGFEYGYSLPNPYTLTIWEAQYGDFINGAQTVIDQYISSAEEKWGQMSGLVMFLPHGYEGQGPENSSARIERFLSLCANNNLQILNCSTPANFFHAIRMQMVRDFRKPLIIFTPKSLLRHPLCVSSIFDLSEADFSEVFDDKKAFPEKITRILLCSGKIYYDLLLKKEKNFDVETAIIRVEQLYPFPMHQINMLLEKYYKYECLIWVQEEPVNMGAWPYIKSNFRMNKLRVIARPIGVSPATWVNKLHHMQQEKIIDKAFGECNCENIHDECNQLCITR